MTRDLVERAQAGDRDAYEQLARGVARQLFVVASRILRDTDAAEDAVQQTLVAIWRDMRSLRDPDRFESWAYRLLVRACSRERRRRSIATVSLITIEDLPATSRDGVADVALRDELRRAFEDLSLQHRIVVVLHHLVGLPLAEVAEILDVPYGTVGSRLHHAMRQMRASIEAADRSAIAGGQPA